MVALAQEFEYPAERPLGFFARHHTHSLGSTLCSNPRGQANLRRRNYDGCDQLDSCSKDPIGYHGNQFNMFAYVSGRPLVKTDSSGKHDDTITYPLPPRDCSKNVEDSVLGACWLVCGFCGNMPWRSNPTGAIYQEALEWAGTVVPTTEGDPNPIGNQALRHCFASAMMTCEFWGPCASCLMNQREIYQLQCSGQTDRDANRAINNNNIGVGIGRGTCDKDEQKRKCLQAFRDGELDTRPDAPDGPHVHPTDPDIDFAD